MNPNNNFEIKIEEIIELDCVQRTPKPTPNQIEGNRQLRILCTLHTNQQKHALAFVYIWLRTEFEILLPLQSKHCWNNNNINDESQTNAKHIICLDMRITLDAKQKCLEYAVVHFPFGPHFWRDFTHIRMFVAHNSGGGFAITSSNVCFFYLTTNCHRNARRMLKVLRKNTFFFEPLV